MVSPLLPRGLAELHHDVSDDTGQNLYKMDGWSPSSLVSSGIIYYIFHSSLSSFSSRRDPSIFGPSILFVFHSLSVPSQSTILLVLVAILVLGMAYVAFESFSRSNVEVARDVLKDEIASMTREILSFYRRPEHIGGGGNSFEKFNSLRRKHSRPKGRKQPPKKKLLWESEHGAYQLITAAKDSVVIEGIGDHIGNDGKNPIRVRGVIKTDDLYFTVLN